MDFFSCFYLPALLPPCTQQCQELLCYKQIQIYKFKTEKAYFYQKTYKILGIFLDWMKIMLIFAQ